MPDISIKCLFEIVDEIAIVEVDDESGRRLLVLTAPPIAYRLQRDGTLSLIEVVDDAE